MKSNIRKMSFLNGQCSERLPIRPPWAIEEVLFKNVCNRCDACIKSCHAKIIQRGDSGFPEVNFSRSGCDFCRACVHACATGAITKDAKLPWSVQASFKSNCLAERGTTCRTCADVCELHAIQFRMRVGGRATLLFNASACNGCGECVSVCPVQAIDMQHVVVQPVVMKPGEYHGSNGG